MSDMQDIVDYYRAEVEHVKKMQMYPQSSKKILVDYRDLQKMLDKLDVIYAAGK